MKSFMENRLYWNQLNYGTIAMAQPNCNEKHWQNDIIFTSLSRIKT